MLHYIANEVFPVVLNMSLTAAVVIVFVLAARLALRRAPKIFSYVLWVVVLFRLLCPVSLTADVSLLKAVDFTSTPRGTLTSSVEYLPSETFSAVEMHMAALGNFDELAGTTPPVTSPAPGAVGQPAAPIPGLEELPVGDEATAGATRISPMMIVAAVWLGGIAALGVYSVVTLLLLRRRLVGAVPLEGNVYLADHIDSPFVLGVLQPKIYLPSTLEGRERGYIIRHEQHHIRRGDHILKGIGFAALCIHWFNPLAWVAFIFAGKDMEMSCDEAVVSALGADIRADYSASLLALATGRRIIAPSPLAFGEGDPKGRIKNMLRWQKPKTWITVTAAVCCLLLVVACGTNPGNEERPADAQRGEYADVAAYVESLMAAQETATFYVDPATPEGGNVVITLVDGQEVREKTTAVIDRRLNFLTKNGELAGLAPEGTLEAWQYRYLVKPEDAEGILLVGGMVEADGYYDLEGQGGRNVVALRYEDGSYDILYDAPVNDNMDFLGYCESYAEVLHDWYVKKHSLDRPLYVEDWTEWVDYPDEKSYGGNFPVHRFDGDGWYLYLPVQAWSKPLKNDAGNYEIYSQYNTGSSIIVAKSDANSETVLQGYLDRGYEMTEVAAVQDDGVEVDSVFVYDAPDGGSYVLHAMWYPESLNDYAPITMEPQVLRLIAENFTVDESVHGEALKPLKEYLETLDGEDLYVGWNAEREGKPDAEKIAAMVRNAMGNVLSNTGMLTMNGSSTDIIWSLDLYVGVGKTGWSGDEIIHLYAGLTNNVVEILSGLHPAGANRIVVNDPALYQLVRCSMDHPAAERIHAETLAKYQTIVDAHLADVPHYGDGVTAQRELIGFYPVDEKKELGAVIYCIDSVLNVTPKEKAPYYLAGGAYVDSDLRIHGVGAPNLLVTIDGEAVGYTSWEWLGYDGGLENVSSREELMQNVTPITIGMPALSYIEVGKVEPVNNEFANLLGYSGYISTESWNSGWSYRNYYAYVDGTPQLMAESFGFDEAQDYVADLDGDGVKELITNNMFNADGVRQVCVYLREGSIIYRGYLWDENLENFDNWGASASWSEFDPEKKAFLLHYAVKGQSEYAVKEYYDLSAFHFDKFADFAPPVAAETVSKALGELTRYMVFDDFAVEFYRVDGSDYRPLVVNGRLLVLLDEAAEKVKVIDNREHISTRGGGIFIELGDSDERHISLFAAEESDTVLLRYVGNSINEVALVNDPWLYMYILATEEMPAVELYDLDEDGKSEALLWLSGSNVKQLVIYDYVAGKTIRTDVNEALGCAASDYTGNISNIKGEYGNMVKEIRSDGSSHIQRYDNGAFIYITTMEDALRST